MVSLCGAEDAVPFGKRIGDPIKITNNLRSIVVHLPLKKADEAHGPKVWFMTYLKFQILDF